MNTNAQFASVLVKYVEAKKLTKSAFTQRFIMEFDMNAEYVGIPTEPTEEMREYAKTFVTKKAKCTDTQFSALMVDWASAKAKEEAPEIVADETVREYQGEY